MTTVRQQDREKFVTGFQPTQEEADPLANAVRLVSASKTISLSAEIVLTILFMLLILWGLR